MSGRSRGRGERGASAVEFAFVMLPLTYLVFGIIQYGLYFYSMQAGTSAVGDAVRRLTVGDCTNSADLKHLLSDRLGAGTTASEAALNPTVTYTNSDGSATAKVGGSVKLALTYPTINMNFPFIPLPNDGLVIREATGRVEDTSPTGVCS